ncbi:MAG: HPr family phosphocarrier protein [Clostridiales Family XIII bacterium]|jgi:phosphocarrier protein|nr:HPr family phosphocarrier protein [Clostridiales Family XIII bacterium]
MIEIKYTITDTDGMHARPAGQLVKEVGKFESSVTITKGEKTGDASRIFAIMSLGIKNGEEITLQVEGKDEVEAAAALEVFLAENL